MTTTHFEAQFVADDHVRALEENRAHARYRPVLERAEGLDVPSDEAIG